MNEYQDRLKDISEIRSMMEQSTRFFSLSGLSGVTIGLIAMSGAWFASQYLEAEGLAGLYREGKYISISTSQLLELLGIGLIILIAAVSAAALFSFRMAKKRNMPAWNSAAKRMIRSFLIPLSVGAIFNVLLAWHGFGIMVAPTTLIFYGMALLHAGKYTLKEIQYLGITEMALGLIAAFFVGYGIYFWVLGFGVLHIVYGLILYLKYER